MQMFPSYKSTIAISSVANISSFWFINAVFIKSNEIFLSNPDKSKLYNHKNELEYKKNSKYKLLFDSGLSFARVVDNSLKIENVDSEELKKLLKSEIIQIDDFKVKK